MLPVANFSNIPYCIRTFAQYIQIKIYFLFNYNEKKNKRENKVIISTKVKKKKKKSNIQYFWRCRNKYEFLFTYKSKV